LKIFNLLIFMICMEYKPRFVLQILNTFTISGARELYEICGGVFIASYLKPSNLSRLKLVALSMQGISIG